MGVVGAATIVDRRRDYLIERRGRYGIMHIQDEIKTQKNSLKSNQKWLCVAVGSFGTESTLVFDSSFKLLK